MTTEERISSFEEHDRKRFEEFASKFPEDIGRLYASYKVLKTQDRWTPEYLNGYLAVISDLIIIKEGHWGS